MLDIKSLLSGYPELIQYVIIIGLILIILYASLILTRFLGTRMGGDKIYFDNPEEYDKSVPELFGGLSRKRRKKKQEPDPAKEKSPKTDKDTVE